MNNEIVSKTEKSPVAHQFIQTTATQCTRIEETLAMLHKGLDRLIPPRLREGKPVPPDPQHHGDYQPTLSEQHALLVNRLTKIQDAVADAVNRLEEFV